MLRTSAAVGSALSAGAPVVALESTIFSHLGLPSPANTEALGRCLSALSDTGATPALTAVLNGVPIVGVEEEHFPTICGPARKVASRDLAVAIAQRWAFGATTVSASLALAAAAGITVFATGGLGGVHRDVGESMDISADLLALAQYPVVTVASGAKVFLDLERTLEYLETAAVPVVGYRCDEFPAFYARSSGIPVPHRANSPREVAAIARAHWVLGGKGVLVANPVPETDAIDPQVVEEAVRRALSTAADSDVKGSTITPIVLAEIARLTDGASVASNLALAESNARLAGEIAAELLR